MNGKDLGSWHTQHENRLVSLNQRLNQLVETIQKLAQARDLETIMSVVRSAARVLTGADGATFVLREGDQCYYADEDAIQPLWKGHRFPMSMCISGWVMMNHEIAVIKDIYADARIPAEAYRPTFVKSLAMVPIRSRDPLGAIGNYWAHCHSPTQEEIQLLQTIADTTAIALENIRLFNEQEHHLIQQKQAEAELTAAYEKLKMLWGVASLADTNIKTIADYILASITQMAESPYGFYGFVNDDESVMTIHTWTGDAMKDCSMVDKPQQYPVCQSGVWAEAIRRREPLIINDYTAPHEAKRGLPEGHVPLTSLLVVPHFSQGKILAVAAVANRAKDYGQEDIDEITGFLGSVQAIADRKQNEEALKRIKKLLTETGRIGNVGGWEFDIETRRQSWTEEVYRIHEVDFLFDPTVKKGVSFYTVSSRPIIEQAVQRAIERGEPFDLELEIVTAKGNLRSVHVIGKADLENRRIYGFFQDITEWKQLEADKKKLEAQNRLILKTESLSRMAAAIAHTFNNQLGAVIGNLEMAIDDLPKGSGLVHSLTAAMQAAQKSAEMSGMMLTYLGQSFDNREILDLSEICRRHLHILKATIPINAALKTSLPSPGPVILASENQLQQILLILITNAWEAIGEDGGSIDLSVKTVFFTEIPEMYRRPIAWQPQESAYACIEVTDTGCGIEDKDIENLFDPFFSCKFTGRGLGLPVALGIIKAHNGTITVESKPREGSTFRVFLPVSAKEVAIKPQKSALIKDLAEGGTILLVEDEQMVREMAATMLSRLGFTVLTAKDGVEAVEIFRERKDEIRLVLSDLTMPRMNGWETLTALRNIAPAVPVILASGYDKAHVMAGDHPELPQAFVAKPYNREALRAAITQALG